MTRTPPVLLDPRAEEDFFNDAIKLAQAYCSSWHLDKTWPSATRPNRTDIGLDPGLALLKLVSPFFEYLADIVNQLPFHRQLAFYRFLDMSLRGAAAAWAPLQFTLADNRPVRRIPKRTAVLDAATQSIRFETDEQLDVIPATLCAALTMKPSADRYVDVQSVLLAGGIAPILSGEHRNPNEKRLGHYLLLGDLTLFNPNSSITAMTIVLNGENVYAEWFERWYDGTLNALETTATSSNGGRTCTIELNWPLPKADAEPGLRTVAALNQSLCSAAGYPLDSADLPSTVDAVTQRYWLVAQPTKDARIVSLVNDYLPSVTSVMCEIEGAHVVPALTAANGAPLKIANGAYPFGKAPSTEDAFYVLLDSTFAHADASVKMNFELQELKTACDAKVEWQFWEGTQWTPFVDEQTQLSDYAFTDSTENLTAASGEVSFVFPATMAEVTIVSHKGYWIRAVLKSGDYGNPGAFRFAAISTTINNIPSQTLDDKSKQAVISYLTSHGAAYSANKPQAGYTPPFIQSLRIDYECTLAPCVMACHNAFALDQPLPGGQPFRPYRPLADESSALYLGFAFGSSDLMQQSLGRQLSLYFDIENETEQDGGVTTWQWFDATVARWRALPNVVDKSAGFSQRGTVCFDLPSEMNEAVLFSKQACWFRAMGAQSDKTVSARGIYPNAVIAHNLTTYTNEILGSSIGVPDQSFSLNHAGVLQPPGQTVGDSKAGSQSPIEMIVIEPVATTNVIAGATQDTMSKVWTFVDSLVGCTPDDRVFTLDPLSGSITFGNGVNGMIPPAGTNNVIAKCYQTTNGQGGNLAKETITLLRPSIAGIASVMNPVAAQGGVDGDSVEDLLKSGPARVRADLRVVTLLDLEALCETVSSRVRRARAIERTFNDIMMSLQQGNGDTDDFDNVELPALDAELPYIDLYLLPASEDTAPRPSQAMWNEIWPLLAPLCAIQICSRIRMRVPSFRSIDVQAVLQTNAKPDQWNALAQEVGKRLAAFLQPAYGGLEGRGWPFGGPVRGGDVVKFLEGQAMKTLGVTKVHKLELCGASLDIELPPDTVPMAGAIDISFVAS